MSLVLVAALIWLPGVLLRRAFALAPGPWGTGRLAVEASLSLAFLSAVLLPLYLASAPVAALPAAAFAATAALAASAWWVSRGRNGREAGAAGVLEGATTAEALAFAAAAALVLPVALAHSGANIDDWWDLSFVRGWIADGHLGFAQMALSPDPDGGGSPAHPRFLWSVWLLMQTLVAFSSGEEPWRIQAGALAGVAAVLMVSAQAALGRAVFRRSCPAERIAAWMPLAAVAWIWGTEALPLFTRGYQDKLFAGFVLAPVMVALVVDCASARAGGSGAPSGKGGAPAYPLTAPRRDARARPRAGLSVAAAAVALVSVHSLIFTMAAFVCGVVVVSLHGHRALSWLRANAGVAAALVLPSLYPVMQALALAGTFGDQGISLQVPDNPVVRAHLTLNRLVGAAGPMWIVSPAAVFGPIAFAGAAAWLLLWRRRRDEPAARLLLAMAATPCLLMFVPGVAAVAGRIWVPWMLYRLGWMVPVAPLLAYAVVALWKPPPRVPARSVAAFGASALVLLLTATTAADRLRRGMEEHPGQPFGAPVAAAATVYDYLLQPKGRDVVLAPPNFSELVPALSAKPVVAFPERGTLVFSGDELHAYERLRDRATFYSARATPDERDAVASRYGVRWAVLPRRLVASGSEEAWLWRFGAQALLAARAADETAGEACGDAGCRLWWSATRAGVSERLSRGWAIVFETRDYFVVERVGRHASAPAVDAAPLRSSSSPRWLGAFELSPQGAVPGTRELVAPAREEVHVPADGAHPALAKGDHSASAGGERLAPATSELLASATGMPGALVRYTMPPRYVHPTPSPIWTDGPGGWEDAPAEADITLDIGVACRISAVELVPHLPRRRREILEVRAEGRSVRAEASDGEAIVVPVDATAARRAVTVHVSSLIGNPISLADIRLRGDRTSCGPQWPVHRKPGSPDLHADTAALLGLSAAHPASGRPFVSLARIAQAGRQNAQNAQAAQAAQGTRATRGAQATQGAHNADDAIGLLVEATRREPSCTQAWIDLGFALDEEAQSHAAAGRTQEADSSRAAARESFDAAVAADSHSAWARGCAAWAEQRAGNTAGAIWNALRAWQLDPFYADAWTVLAYALGDLRLHGLAERVLQLAEAQDPERNWPVLARADLALGRGDPEAARAALRGWILEHPFDTAARTKLADVAAAASGTRQP